MKQTQWQSQYNVTSTKVLICPLSNNTSAYLIFINRKGYISLLSHLETDHTSVDSKHSEKHTDGKTISIINIWIFYWDSCDCFVGTVTVLEDASAEQIWGSNDLLITFSRDSVVKCIYKQLPPSKTLFSCFQHVLYCVWLTVLLSKLLCLLIRDIPLGLQVCFVSYENNHLRIHRQNRKNETILYTARNVFPNPPRAKKAEGSKERLFSRSCSFVELSVKRSIMRYTDNPTWAH